MTASPPSPPAPSQPVRLFRWYAALVFSFAWVPVMYTAFTVDRGFDNQQYLQLWSAYYLAMVLAELPWGWLADRVGPRPLLVAGPISLAGCFILLGHSESFGVCRLAMALTGASHAMISGADSAYLYEVLLRGDRRGAALHEEAVAHRWRLFGVSGADLAGGFVAAALGTLASFHLSVAIMVAAALVALRLPGIHAEGATRRRPRLDLAWDQLRRPDVVWVVAWSTMVFVFLRLGFQLYQPTLLAVGAVDLRLHGGLLAVLNLVAGISAIFLGRLHERFGERWTTLLVGLAMVVSFAGLAMLHPILLTPLFCLQQVSFGFMQPLGRTALNHRVRSQERASLLSVQSMVSRAGFGLLLLLLSTKGWDRAPAEELGHVYRVLAGSALLLALLLFVLHRKQPATESGDRS